MCNKYSTKADVWSFGIVLIEIFSYGKEPYEGKYNEFTCSDPQTFTDRAVCQNVFLNIQPICMFCISFCNISQVMTGSDILWLLNITNNISFSL